MRTREWIAWAEQSEEEINRWEKEIWIAGIINDNQDDENWDMCLVKDLVKNSDCYNSQEKRDKGNNYVSMYVFQFKRELKRHSIKCRFRESDKNMLKGF